MQSGSLVERRKPTDARVGVQRAKERQYDIRYSKTDAEGAAAESKAPVPMPQSRPGAREEEVILCIQPRITGGQREGGSVGEQKKKKVPPQGVLGVTRGERGPCFIGFFASRGEES